MIYIFLEFIFWTSLLIVVYTFIGYPILMTLLSKMQFVKYLIKMPEGFGRVLLNPKIGGFVALEDRLAQKDFEPTVSVIIAAYNEEKFIEDKIKNCLQLNYPQNKIEFLFVTDGSTDNTLNILEKYKPHNFRYYHSPERKGKLHAINRIVKLARNDILIFSDANAIYNKDAVKNLVRHFAHKKVGCVSGEKKVLSRKGEITGESLYWKYESYLKKLDSELYSVVGAAGEIFAIRKNLYFEIPQDSILEDFVFSVKFAEIGYRVVYEPNAYSIETPPKSFKDDFKRRLRISTGGIQSINMFKKLLNLKQYRFLAFQFISHRVLRWTVVPIVLIVIFFSNLFLADFQYVDVYYYFMIGQIVFYSLAIVGFISEILRVHIWGINLIFSFVLMNFAALIGILSYPFRVKTNIWEKTERIN